MGFIIARLKLRILTLPQDYGGLADRSPAPDHQTGRYGQADGPAQFGTVVTQLRRQISV